VEGLREASAIMQSNPKMLNIIIDGELFADAFDENLAKVTELCRFPNAMILLCLTDEQAKAYSVKEQGLVQLVVKPLPFDKAVFNDTFHGRGGKSQSMTLSPFGQTVATVPKEPEAKVTKPVNVTAFEASGHVRDCIAYLNVLDRNRSAFDELAKIGQVFNGLVGSFAFFAKQASHAQIRDMALCIEAICRYYQDGKSEKVSDEHFQVLAQAAKSCFKILQLLRDEQPVPEAMIKDAQSVTQHCVALNDIKMRTSISQDDIDLLLAN
jgi:hypothetical protein